MKKLSIFLVAVALMASLAACGNKTVEKAEDTASAAVENAAETVEDTAKDATNAVEGAASDAVDKVEEVATDAKDAVEGTGTATDLKLTLDELSKYNGKDGQPAYVAVDGVIYDVTDNKAWKEGEHQGYAAGTDMTEVIKSAPHGDKVLAELKVVGKLTK